MWNKKRRKRASKPQQQQQQICIPKCCQQPRSRGLKPRTDFSLFIISSASSSSSSSSSSYSSSSILLRRHRGAMLEFSRYKDSLSIIAAAANADHGCQGIISIHKKEMPGLSLVQCSVYQKEHRKNVSNSTGLPFPETESALSQNTCLDTAVNGTILQHTSDSGAQLACTPDKSTSQVIESSDVCPTPGSTVWAKTAYQMWWPAKFIEEGSSMAVSSDQGADGRVLVQYYGSYECAWVDPDRDISQFDYCFEERSSNPLTAFQDALKQALDQEEHLSSCKQLDEKPDELKSLSHHEEASDEWIESSSSRAENSLERGRGKRKRKPKIHFDEVTFPMKSTKRIRRFRIMRNLGLTAPVGSPFSPASRASILDPSADSDPTSCTIKCCYYLHHDSFSTCCLKLKISCTISFGSDFHCLGM